MVISREEAAPGILSLLDRLDEKSQAEIPTVQPEEAIMADDDRSEEERHEGDGPPVEAEPTPAPAADADADSPAPEPEVVSQPEPTPESLVADEALKEAGAPPEIEEIDAELVDDAGSVGARWPDADWAQTEFPRELLLNLDLHPNPLAVDRATAVLLLSNITTARRFDLDGYAFVIDHERDNAQTVEPDPQKRPDHWVVVYDSLISGDERVSMSLTDVERSNVEEKPHWNVSRPLLRYVIRLLPALGLAKADDVSGQELPPRAVAYANSLIEGRQTVDQLRAQRAHDIARGRARRYSERDKSRSRGSGRSSGADIVLAELPEVERIKRFLLREIKAGATKGLSDKKALKVLADLVSTEFPDSSLEDRQAALTPVIEALRGRQ